MSGSPRHAAAGVGPVRGLPTDHRQRGDEAEGTTAQVQQRARPDHRPRVSTRLSRHVVSACHIVHLQLYMKCGQSPSPIVN